MRRLVLGVLVLLLSGLPAAPVGAITFGQLDGTLHPWVGALVAETSPGVKQPVCSGTLIAPRVFLTAAHCMEWAAPVWVTFDPAFTESSTLYEGSYTVDPFYFKGPKHDLAVVLLAQTPPITPAVLPSVGVLDGPGIRQQGFTAVGYGDVRDDKTAGWHSFFNDGQRRYVGQTFQSLTDTVVTFSENPATGNGGTCYGDSGGPHFVGTSNVIVAVTSAGDTYCRSTDKTYRIDTAESLAFIDSFITP